MARKKRTAVVTAQSLPLDLALLVAAVWDIAGAPAWEYEFDPVRKWRFDLAWPQILVAFEREGVGGRHPSGIGRHQTAEGMAGDCEKYNAAAIAGWLVVRGTARMLASGLASEQLAAALTVRSRPSQPAG